MNFDIEQIQLLSKYLDQIHFELNNNETTIGRIDENLHCHH